jgi:hypothetical protein
VRLRVWEPPPHDCVHVPHASNSTVTTQFTAQQCMLQLRASVSCGQALPPAWGDPTVRSRYCEPLSHDAVHVVQLPQSSYVQSAGQACVLHERVSSKCGHASPPSDTAVAALRERDCEPVPHEAVHVVQTLKAVTSQSVGQACVLHASVSSKCGHASPPFCTAVETLRERDCEPVPHEAVHVVQALKSLTTQSFGHAWLLHARCSCRYGHW